MIVRGVGGVSPSFEFAIDGVPVDYTSLSSIEIGMSENHHDILRVTMSGLPVEAVEDYRNRTVLLDINTGPNYSEKFVGYVQSVNPKSTTAHGTVNYSLFQTAEVVAMGASYEMRGSRSHVWEGYSLHDLATHLARRHHLSVSVPHSANVYERMVQTEESDWQFLVRIADQMGYRVTCHGTHIHVFDPFQATSRNISQHKLLTRTNTGPSDRLVPGMVQEFSLSARDEYADGDYKDTIVTVMSPDGSSVPFDVSTSEIMGKDRPARFQNRLAHPVDNYGEAVRMIKSVGKDQHDMEAEVKCVSMLGCRPGGIVYIDGYGASLDGMWYVSEVEHRVHEAQAQTTLKINKNRNSDLEEAVGPSLIKVPDSFFDGTIWRTNKEVYNVY